VLSLYYIEYQLCKICTVEVKSKDIPVTGHGSPQVFETSRLPHFLDNRLIDGGKVVGLTLRPPFNPRKILSTNFCYNLSPPQGHIAAGRIRSIEKPSGLTENQTRDLPASTNCSTACLQDMNRTSCKSGFCNIYSPLVATRPWKIVREICYFWVFFIRPDVQKNWQNMNIILTGNLHLYVIYGIELCRTGGHYVFASRAFAGQYPNKNIS
jgi:hypothetical protein